MWWLQALDDALMEGENSGIADYSLEKMTRMLDAEEGLGEDAYHPSPPGRVAGVRAVARDLP
ncbi:MAG: hypothetical protein ACK48P_07600 [Holosporales bacterium]|jgi:hypothetical protein